MLNEIIQKVTEKTGISQENASAAVTMVLECLKKKLPGPVASQIDSLLGGAESAGSSISDAMHHAKESASGAFDSAKEKLGSIFHKDK